MRSWRYQRSVRRVTRRISRRSAGDWRYHLCNTAPHDTPHDRYWAADRVERRPVLVADHAAGSSTTGPSPGLRTSMSRSPPPANGGPVSNASSNDPATSSTRWRNAMLQPTPINGSNGRSGRNVVSSRPAPPALEEPAALLERGLRLGRHGEGRSRRR